MRLCFLVFWFIIVYWTRYSKGSLYAVWEQNSPQLLFSVAELDPTTGRYIEPVLYTNNSLEILFGGNSAFDTTRGLWFMQVYSPSPTIIALNMTNVNQINLIYEFPVPFEVFVIEFDEQMNQLIIAGVNLEHTTDFNVLVGVIDMNSLTFKQIAKLPTDHFFLTVSGSASCLDPISRLLFIGTGNQIEDPPQYFIDTVNIDTGSVNSYIQSDQYIQSFVCTSGQIYAFLSNSTGVSTISVALVDPLSVELTVFNAWDAYPNLVFVVNGIAVAAENKIYSIIGSGFSIPVALVTISLPSANILEYHYFQTSGMFTQPQYIQFII